MFIKRPNAHRKTYALIGRDGKTVDDARVAAINADLARGMSSDILEARMQAILRSYRPPKTPLSISNDKLVHEVHRKKVQRKPDIVNPDGLLQRLQRAASHLGNVSIREASEDEIYAALADIKVPAQRYEIRRGVNELLRYCKRPFLLHNPVPDRPDEIAFIRVDAFKRAAREMPDHYAAVLGALFATGCRWAELPVAQLSPEAATITRQLKSGPRLAPTKNKRSRVAPVLPPLREFVERYRRLDREARYSLCLSNHKRVYYACKQALGIRLHDLRHSYCVEWGAVGSSTAELARYIGDQESVTERHYRNYCMTSDELKRALARWSK